MPPKTYSRRKRNTKGFRVLRVNTSFALGTLGVTTWLKSVLLANLTQEIYAISADLNWSLSNLTSVQGPIIVGLAHGDYSVAEIKEWFQASNTLSGDQIEQEENRRKCRDAGMFETSATVALGHVGLKDGKTVRTQLKFRIEESKDLVAWAANLGAEALSITDPIVEVYGKVYLRTL